MLLRKYRKHQDGHGNNENYEYNCCILLSTTTNSNQKPHPTSFEKTASKPSLYAVGILLMPFMTQASCPSCFCDLLKIFI